MDNEETTPLILSEWVEIQSAFSSDESQWCENENPVVIGDYFFNGDSGVFPPSNHEDLPVDSLNQAEQVEGGQSQVAISSSSSGGGHGVGGEGKVGKWMRRDGSTTTLGSLSSAIGKFFSGAASKASLWWFGTATTGVGALALVVVLSRRAKRWRRKALLQPAADHISNQQLTLLLQSKDQKISQLLLQVSQLNDMLLARRRVPVLQLG